MAFFKKLTLILNFASRAEWVVLLVAWLCSDLTLIPTFGSGATRVVLLVAWSYLDARR